MHLSEGQINCCIRLHGYYPNMCSLPTELQEMLHIIRTPGTLFAPRTALKETPSTVRAYCATRQHLEKCGQYDD